MEAPRPWLSKARAPAVGAGLLCLLFLAVTAWWLSADQRVPDFDSGKHLLHSFDFATKIENGDPLAPFTSFTDYPPLAHTVASIGVLIGGQTDTAPVLTLAIVFMPLLVFSVFRTGVLLADARVGLLAVVFVLGAPMLSTMSHGFFLETPATALAAATMWLGIESDRFARWPWALAAGVAVGAGILTKQTFAFFVAGFLLVMLLRGGWRNPRGLAIFAVAAVAVAAPWYLSHLSDLNQSLTYAEVPPDPPRWSIKNYSWFAWGHANHQLWVPLGLLVVGGAVASGVRWLRDRDRDDWTPELVVALVVGYLGITFGMGVHAPYYTLPMLPFEALVATLWIARLRRRAFAVAATALGVVAAANFAGVNFIGGKGLGFEVGTPNAANNARYLTIWGTQAWVSGPPVEDGPVPEIMRAARRDGVARMEFDVAVDRFDFNPTGLTAMAAVEDLERPPAFDPASLGPRDAFITARPVTPDMPPPCGTLASDGAGVYLVRGNAARPPTEFDYCPTRDR